MKIDWKAKLSSRKLWVAVAGLVTGIVILATSNESTASEIGGLVMTFGSIVAYIVGEGLVDSKRIESNTKEEDKE